MFKGTQYMLYFHALLYVLSSCERVNISFTSSRLTYFHFPQTCILIAKVSIFSRLAYKSALHFNYFYKKNNNANLAVCIFWSKFALKKSYEHKATNPMNNPTQPCNFTLPAEWAPQSGIMLTWPHAGTDWKPYLRQITDTYLQMADVITKYEHLLVATPFKESTHAMLSERLSTQQMERVHIFEVDSNDTWARDHGPITLVCNAKSSSYMMPFQILDFGFNGWGEKFKWKKDNAINLQLYYQGAFKDCAIENHLAFILEGGSIESNGRGTVFTTSQCLMAPHRNQPFSQKDIEQTLKILLHAHTIVWLDHGNLVGDDTDGHIDTIVRVAPHDTLLYVGCDNPEDEQYEDFRLLEEQLQQLTTFEGYPYRLLRLPMPDAIYDEGNQLSTSPDSKGERLPATYANFLILNRAVIYPTYDQPQKDEEARRQLQLAFPDREIIGINALTIIRQHGSIHCLTMQLPEGMLRDK